MEWEKLAWTRSITAYHSPPAGWASPSAAIRSMDFEARPPAFILYFHHLSAVGLQSSYIICFIFHLTSEVSIHSPYFTEFAWTWKRFKILKACNKVPRNTKTARAFGIAICQPFAYITSLIRSHILWGYLRVKYCFKCPTASGSNKTRSFYSKSKPNGRASARFQHWLKFPRHSSLRL